MKGYEDLVAGLLLLVVILVGGYTYLNSQLIKQKEVLQIPSASQKSPQKHQEVKTFESKSKATE